MKREDKERHLATCRADLEAILSDIDAVERHADPEPPKRAREARIAQLTALISQYEKELGDAQGS